jgi:hypothetical protein
MSSTDLNVSYNVNFILRLCISDYVLNVVDVYTIIADAGVPIARPVFCL